MKRILILILITIVLIFSYNTYKEYQRFHNPNNLLQASKDIDVNYFDSKVLIQYYEQLEQLNSYITMMWSVYKIDVRSPEHENAETKYAINHYYKLKAVLLKLEETLKYSKKLKLQGASNDEIENSIKGNKTLEELELQEAQEKYRNRILNTYTLSFKSKANYIALVYEVQKLLYRVGYKIVIDGLYNTETEEAMKAFEKSNELMPDGKLDLLSLELLIDQVQKNK